MTSLFTLVGPEHALPCGLNVCTTSRVGGISKTPYASFNLGLHVGDDPSAVQHNRNVLRKALSLPGDPLWLRQTHSTAVFRCGNSIHAEDEYDAAYAHRQSPVLVVLTADCLPVVFMSSDGEQYAIAHAGWRGLANGILQATVQQFYGETTAISTWLGPAIGPSKFEVGEDVLSTFLRNFSDQSGVKAAFTPAPASSATAPKWYADLYQLARLALFEVGVEDVSGGDFCTFSDSQKFYSYRRDGVHSGRMATLIWRV